MMQDGKVGPTIHKNPITSEQLQQLYETGQLGEWDTMDPSQLLRTAWFTSPFIWVKGGVKIRKSSPQTCCFFGVHLKGDVTMSFAATLHPKIIKVV